MKTRYAISFVFLLSCYSLVGCDRTTKDYTIIRDYFAEHNNYAEPSDYFYGIQKQIGAITALMCVDKNENTKGITISCIEISETDSSGSVFYGDFYFEYGKMLEAECIVYTRYEDANFNYKCEFELSDFVFDENGTIDFTYAERTETFNNFPSSWNTAASKGLAVAEMNLMDVISYYDGYLKANGLPSLNQIETIRYK